ncbi:TcpQ domain-containing protein [Chromobacterium vaccinii]|uniref:TcpQ domain-containing protein n=1 Tax=Chromobacterium vaccinii TaxID=1108595 RepID=UPI00345899FB
MVLLTLLGLSSVAGAAAQNQDKPQFNYEIEGDTSVAPINLYTQSGQVYMLFADPAALPALSISTDRVAERERVKPALQGALAILRKVPKQIFFELEGKTAVATQIIRPQLSAQTEAATDVVADAQTTCDFEVMPSDETLQKSLERWSKKAGWQSPKWQFRTVYVDYYANFCGPGGIEGAVDRLMAAMNASAINTFANYYDNNVIEIIER